MKAPRLATLLTLGFTGLFWLAVISMALVLRFGVETNFQTYLDTAQAAAHGQIMGTMAALDSTQGHDQQERISTLGQQALEQGLVLAVRDSGGKVIWDARTEDPARVDRVFHDLEGRLRARAPWERGRWEAWEHPLGTPEGTGGTMVVEVFQPRRLGPSDLAFLQGIDFLLGVLAAGGLVLSVLLGSLTARAVVRPLTRVQKAAHRMAEGDYRPPEPVRSAFSEGRDLEASLAALAGRLSRLQALRETAGADTAHELRTPLANLGAQLEALEDGVLAPTPERFASLGTETRRLLALVEAWEDLEHARTPEAGALPCQDPSSVVRDAAETFQARTRAKGQRLTVHLGPGIPPTVLPAEGLGRIVVNLVENAHRHAPEAGRIAVTLESTKDAVVLLVDDDGPGIEPKHRDAVFDRFYRVDPSRSRVSGGLGLGLSLVKALAESTGGRVGVEASPWGGCRIRVMLARP